MRMYATMSEGLEATLPAAVSTSIHEASASAPRTGNGRSSNSGA
jgi:hypothetical protein